MVTVVYVCGTPLVVPRGVVVVVAVVVERPVDIQHWCYLFHLEVHVLVFRYIEFRIDAFGTVVAAATAQGRGGDMSAGGGEVRLAFDDGSWVSRYALRLQLLVA